MTETENTAIQLFTEKFGKDLYSRFQKLDEEYRELMDAWDDYKNNIPGARKHLIDELSDMNAVKTHICGILGISNDKLLIDAIIKVKIREINPKYLREEMEEVITSAEHLSFI